MIEFLQGEPNTDRRKWIIVLVDSADGVTGKTAQTGQAYISINGGTPTLSTNSIVEIDATNMPGQYYLILTPAEVSTLGFISITMKTASTLAFHDRGFVTYDNPFASSGGFSGAVGGGKGGFTLKQIEDLIKRIWKYKVTPNLTAEDALVMASKEIEMPPMPVIPDYTESFKQLFAKETDLTPIFDMINSLPKPNDYSTNFETLAQQAEKIQAFLENNVNNQSEFVQAIQNYIKTSQDFQTKVQSLTPNINNTLAEVDKLKSGFGELETMMQKFKEIFDENTNLDRKMAKFGLEIKDNNLSKLAEDMNKKFTELQKMMINMKYDLMSKLIK